MNFISISQTSIFILTFSFLSISSLFSETILYKNGQILKAKVVDQGPLVITIEKEDKTRSEITKNQILKVIFKETTNEELEKIKQEEMKKQEDKHLAKLKKEQEERDNFLEELKQKKLIEERERSLASSKQSSAPFFTSNYFYSPVNNTVTLANSTTTCAPFKSKKQWFVLFGSVPLNTIKPEDIFDSNGSYKVYFKSTVLDIIASVLLGLTTSVTLKTVFVENCSPNSEPVIVLQKKELEALLNKNKETATEELKKEIEETNSMFKK